MMGNFMRDEFLLENCGSYKATTKLFLIWARHAQSCAANSQPPYCIHIYIVGHLQLYA